MPNLLTGAAAVAEGEQTRKAGPSGYHRRMASESYRGRVAEAGRLFVRAYNGDLHAQADLREAMSTSDFPILFGDFLNRTLAAQYAARPPVWQQFAARTTVRDFRPQKIIDFLGGAGLLDDVAEYGEYPARSLSEAELEITVGKKGARLQWSWEMNINDDLGAFQRAPGQLSRGARSTEDHTVTSVLCDASGPKAWLGTPATGALTQDTLNAGLEKLNTAVDTDGNPIDVGTPVLVIPPGQQLVAQQIVHTTEVRQTSASKTTIQAGNGLLTVPQIVVNRWLSSINTTNGDTAWYLLPDPNSARPAVFAAFLRGHESPDLRVKADAGMMLGGGQIDPAEGSFERDDIQYRLRHVLGGAQGFDDAVFVSTGA
ncbi:MAG TPA: hypothetical protein VGK78_09315 [Nocardioides sp.]|uniref:phage major capsid protein n=1 Tax=Nocardioides sp. TaxID=35761 RepID=UPI002F4090B8